MMNGERVYDIKERTFRFAVEIVHFVSGLPRDTAGYALGRQLIRSGTSIGANVEEAAGARTKKEFINSMNVAKREARETLFWLRVLKEAALVSGQKVNAVLSECNELVSILTTIVKRAEGHS